MWKTRSKLLFTASTGISGVILMQMGMYAGHHIFGWGLNLNVFQICRQLLQNYGVEYIADALTGLVVLTFGVAGILAIRQCIATSAAFRKLKGMQNDHLTEELNSRYPAFGPDRIWVIEHRKPAAFTMGLLTPRIVLSSGLLAVLNRQEEEAVVYHEAYHMRHFDPLKTWIMNMCSSLLFYVPVLHHIVNHYKTAREILADNEAIRRTGSPAGLGSALLKLLRITPQSDRPVSTAVYSSFAEISINYRISRILDPHKDLAPRLPWRPIVVSGYVLIILSSMFALALI